jgi:hypothetical protein
MYHCVGFRAAFRQSDSDAIRYIPTCATLSGANFGAIGTRGPLACIGLSADDPMLVRDVFDDFLARAFQKCQNFPDRIGHGLQR